MVSAAHASTAQETPAAAKITAAKMPNLAIRASLAQRARLYVGTKLAGNTEPAPYTAMPENSDASGGPATVISKGQKWSAATGPLAPTPMKVRVRPISDV